MIGYPLFLLSFFVVYSLVLADDRKKEKKQRTKQRVHNLNEFINHHKL